MQSEADLLTPALQWTNVFICFNVFSYIRSATKSKYEYKFTPGSSFTGILTFVIDKTFKKST